MFYGRKADVFRPNPRLYIDGGLGGPLPFRPLSGRGAFSDRLAVGCAYKMEALLSPPPRTVECEWPSAELAASLEVVIHTALWKTVFFLGFRR